SRRAGDSEERISNSWQRRRFLAEQKSLPTTGPSKIGRSKRRRPPPCTPKQADARPQQSPFRLRREPRSRHPHSHRGLPSYCPSTLVRVRLPNWAASSRQERVADLPPIDALLGPRLSAAHLEVLRRHGEVRSTVAGQVLFREGDRGHDFIVILSGAVMVVDHQTGVERELVRGGPGEFSAELSLLTGER